MIPIRDQIPTRQTPYINYLLIALNILVFIFMLLAGTSQEALVYTFAMIPSNFFPRCRISNPCPSLKSASI